MSFKEHLEMISLNESPSKKAKFWQSFVRSLKELIRDRLVIGIRDTKVSENLQMHSELTLEETVDKTAQAERIKVENKELRGEIENTSRVSIEKDNLINKNKKRFKIKQLIRIAIKKENLLGRPALLNLGLVKWKAEKVKMEKDIAKRYESRIISNSSDKKIVMGDFNAHHQIWGCEINDSYGNQLLDAIDSQNLILINDGSPTRISRPHERKSAIDLTLCSPKLFSDLSWKIFQDNAGSDHLPILVEYNNTCEIKKIPPKSKWNTKLANWDYFSEVVNSNLQLNSVNTYEEFQKVLENSADSSIPKSKISLSQQSKPLHWITPACLEYMDQRKTALQNYKHNCSQENYLTFKKAEAKTKRLIKRTKKMAWRKY
ncbi:hypothetical protein NQ314_016139 [Rhamnusium bicolor]|uniref:Endonuclease/exonuclease/phosphatase domain-containing protein n=1 Tax=Rhamnusium bicolor TaxID=1586634 RepID=A0AAV8WWL5_9CUCU|nr:hypothetical protein NQ314_016139 [Rhamnusium bicolor]